MNDCFLTTVFKFALSDITKHERIVNTVEQYTIFVLVVNNTFDT